MSHDTKLSRALSSVLRHKAVQLGLDIDHNGWVKVEDLFRLSRFKGRTIDELQAVTADNDKKRFSLRQSENGSWYIRANQGHSISTVKPDDRTTITLNNYQDYPVVVHGTYPDAWSIIQQQGLSRMSRQDIHFAKGLPGSDGVISGMRKSAKVHIYIDLHKALSDGVPFYESANGVVLSPGIGDTGIIPPRYFKQVTGV